MRRQYDHVAHSALEMITIIFGGWPFSIPLRPAVKCELVTLDNSRAALTHILAACCDCSVVLLCSWFAWFAECHALVPFFTCFQGHPQTAYQGNLVGHGFRLRFRQHGMYYTNQWGDAYPPQRYCDSSSWHCDNYDIREYRIKQEEYSTGASLWAQLLLVVIYNLGAWYFGQTSSSDEGVSQT